MIRKLILFVLSLSFLTAVANAGSVTISGTAQAIVINGIKMEITQELSLGTIILGTINGAVEMFNNGVLGNILGNHIFLGDSKNGIISIVGEPNLAVTLNITGGNDWISGPNSLYGVIFFGNDTTSQTVSLDTNGQGSAILVGGFYSLPAATPSGVYETSFEIEANW